MPKKRTLEGGSEVCPSKRRKTNQKACQKYQWRVVLGNTQKASRRKQLRTATNTDCNERTASMEGEVTKENSIHNEHIPLSKTSDPVAECCLTFIPHLESGSHLCLPNQSQDQTTNEGFPEAPFEHIFIKEEQTDETFAKETIEYWSQEEVKKKLITDTDVFSIQEEIEIKDENIKVEIDNWEQTKESESSQNCGNSKLFHGGLFEDLGDITPQFMGSASVSEDTEEMSKFKKKPEGKSPQKLSCYRNWSEIEMMQAVSSVLERKMTVTMAANHFNVPSTSLRRRIKLVLGAQQTEIKPQMGFFKPAFESHYEEMLVAHMKNLDSRLMPLAKIEFLKLAYDLAETFRLPHRFNIEKKIAGKDFYMNFIKRHPELAYRKAQSTSLMRCVGFNKPKIEESESLQNCENSKPFNGGLFEDLGHVTPKFTGSAFVSEDTKMESYEEKQRKVRELLESAPEPISSELGYDLSDISDVNEAEIINDCDNASYSEEKIGSISEDSYQLDQSYIQSNVTTEESESLQNCDNPKPFNGGLFEDLGHVTPKLTGSAFVSEDTEVLHEQDNQQLLKCEVIENKHQSSITVSTLEVKTPARTYKRTTPKCQRPTAWGVKEEGKEQEKIYASLEPKPTLSQPSKKEKLIQVISDKSTDILGQNPKRHNCLFCNRKVLCVTKHLLEKHQDNEIVAAIKDLSGDSREKELIRLKRIGDFQHNAQILIIGSGKLHVLGEEPQDVGVGTFLPCPDCAGFVHESRLIHHHSLCLLRDKSILVSMKRNLLDESHAMLVYLRKDEFLNFRKAILNQFNPPFLKLSAIAKNDMLIMLLGHYLMISENFKITSAVILSMIRMGMLLSLYRKNCHQSKIQFCQLMAPEKLTLLMNTFKTLFSSANKHEKLELYKCFYSHISVIAHIWRGKCLLEGRLSSAEKALQFFFRFTDLYKKELISDKTILKNLEGLVPELLIFVPSLSDILGLKHSLTHRIVQLTCKLEYNSFNQPSKSVECTWHKLVEATICLICVTNPVDFEVIKRLTLSEYAVRPDRLVDDQREYESKINKVPPVYRFLGKQVFVGIKFQGTETVVSLIPVVKKAVDTLIKKRKEAGISLSNPYIFAANNNTTLKAVSCVFNLRTKDGGFFPCDVMRNTRMKRFISHIIRISEMAIDEVEYAKIYLKSSKRTLLELSPHTENICKVENEFEEALHAYEVNPISSQINETLHGKVKQLIFCNENQENLK